MKKGVLILVSIFFASFVSAQACTLSAQIINQDPYPAIPGDYVKVLFQLDGVYGSQCGDVTFELIEEYPFSLDPGVNPVFSIPGGTYVSDFRPEVNIPFKLRVDEGAINGDNEVEVRFGGSRDRLYVVGKFNISVEEVRTDFEISIKDYVASTNVLTFEILNVGEADAEALTVDIPQQSNVQVKGSKRNIVGSLDSNEDTSFTFEAVPSDGEIKLEIRYTDEAGIRRVSEKTVVYESDYFVGRVRDVQPAPVGLYVGILVVIGVVVWFFWARAKKRRRLDMASRRR